MNFASPAERLSTLNSDFPELSREDKSELSTLAPAAFQTWFFLAKNLNKKVCRSCLNEHLQKTYSKAPDQLAAVIRDLRVKGFDIPKGEKTDCRQHGPKTADQLKSLTPVEGESRLRHAYSPKERKTMLGYFNKEDAFDFDATQAVELDHRIPMSRASENEARIDPNNEPQVRKTFMPLTRVHNLQKDRACQSCITSGNRPAFLGIKHWFVGQEKYEVSVGCDGCGWAYPEQWRQTLQKKIN